MDIKLLVFDVDGVLTDGEARALDLEFLGQLATMNKSARLKPAAPAITLCTGRPAPYVEALLQAIDGWLPAVFENGAGLYVPEGYRFLSHPDLANPDHGHLNLVQAVRSRLDKTLVKERIATIQPGKEYSFSLFATDPAGTGRLLEQTTEALGPLSEAVDMVYSASCLNLLPRGIDKGKGLAYLSELTGYRLEEMLGVGDSDIDLSFLSLVGFSAAPGNANQRVKEMVDYVASQPTSAGVREILAHLSLAQLA